MDLSKGNNLGRWELSGGTYRKVGAKATGSPCILQMFFWSWDFSACLKVEAPSVHCFSQCTIKPLHK